MSNLNLDFKTVGGLTVPVGMPDYQAFLTIVRFGWVPRYWRRVLGAKGTAVELGLMHPSQAIIEAIRSIFDRREFEIQAWSQRILEAVASENNETVIVGPASSGKSEALGLFLLLNWGLAPKSTTCFLVSTTVPQLRRRSFGAVARYHAILKRKGFPGIYSRQLTMIANEDEMAEGITSSDIKSGVLGIAAEGGKNSEEAASRIGGIHQSTPADADNEGEGGIYVMIDEAQAIPEAIFRASVNLRSGADFFRIFAAGNIFHTSGNSLADRAEPRHGWQSVDMETDEWSNVREASRTVRLDGFRSPAVIEPDGEDKYPYLIGPTHIKNILQEVRGNEQDPYFAAMVRAFPSDSDSTAVVLAAATQSKFRCREPADWYHGQPERKFIGVDPAWTSGGDNAVATLVYAGMMTDGVFGLEIQPPVYLKIDANSKVPTQYQLADQISTLMQREKVRLSDTGYDETGGQLLADVMIMGHGAANDSDPVRISFSARASDRPVSAFSDQKANQRYANAATELWFSLSEYASYGHIRGLTGKAAHQFATRQIVPDKRPLRLEKKIIYKARLRAGSPDEADSAAIGVYVAALRLCLTPGASAGNPSGARGFLRSQRQTSPTTDYCEPTFETTEIS